jgi:Chromo (CHRromatin Organisation MOdifier) domain
MDLLLMYGYCPDFTVPPGPPTKFPALNFHLLTLQETRKEAEAAFRMKKYTMKQTFESNKPPPQMFTLGEKVWLSSKDITVSGPGRKLTPWQLGPYEVVDRTGELTYCLRLPPSMHQHPVFHVDHLSPWHGNETNGLNTPPPPPVQINDKIEYEIEAILDSRKYRNQYQYLVKWNEYDFGHNSWEPTVTNYVRHPQSNRPHGH